MDFILTVTQYLQIHSVGKGRAVLKLEVNIITTKLERLVH